MFVKSITNEEIAILPLGSFEGEISVITNMAEMRRACAVLKRFKVLGFDTETRPSFKRGRINEVSLLQLATAGHSYLFRLNLIGMPDEVCSLLSDPAIIKIGAAVKDDIRVLQKKNDFSPERFIDIQKFSSHYDIHDNSLRKLAAIVLGIRISKAQRLSNWEMPELTEAQIRYAATDAWVCLEVYRRLIEWSRPELI
jgi:ribonuclease D